MMTSKKSLKISKPTKTTDRSSTTRSFSLTQEMDDELNQFTARLKRSRSSIIVEALQIFFLNNAPKDG